MNERRVIALGFFDGVHIGHGALLKKTCERAKALGAIPAAMSFDTHPDTLIECLPSCRTAENAARYEPITYDEYAIWYASRNYVHQGKD